MHFGTGEIVVVLAVALLFFGPKRLPSLGSSIGSAIRSFKKGVSGDASQEEEEQEKLPTSTTRQSGTKS